MKLFQMSEISSKLKCEAYEVYSLFFDSPNEWDFSNRWLGMCKEQEKKELGNFLLAYGFVFKK